jgi:hypothetical protein
MTLPGEELLNELIELDQRNERPLPPAQLIRAFLEIDSDSDEVRIALELYEEIIAKGFGSPRQIDAALDRYADAVAVGHFRHDAVNVLLPAQKEAIVASLRHVYFPAPQDPRCHAALSSGVVVSAPMTMPSPKTAAGDAPRAGQQFGPPQAMTGSFCTETTIAVPVASASAIKTKINVVIFMNPSPMRRDH